MPRAKKVVMVGITADESHDAAISKSIRHYQPFAVTTAELVQTDDENNYAVVYRAPRGGKRKVYATRSVRKNATTLRDLLNEAWAEGLWSSGRE